MVLKKSLNWFGSVLAILGCAFVIYNLYKYGGQINLHSIGIYDWLAIVCLSILYGVAGMLLALAWRQLLAYFGVIVPYRFSIYAYGVSQLARYLPGNVFHLASRQAIGAAAGLPGWTLAKSMFWELVFISITGSLFAILIMPLMIPEFSFYFSGIMFVFIVTCFFCTIKRFFSYELSHVIANYVLYLTCSGLIFVAVLALVAPLGTLAPALILPICGAYVIAWLAGLVTPGAPAGIGVRELVLLTMLRQYIGQADLLTAILIGRMVTVGGDFVFYLTAMLWFRSEQLFLEKKSS